MPTSHCLVGWIVSVHSRQHATCTQLPWATCSWGWNCGRKMPVVGWWQWWWWLREHNHCCKHLLAGWMGHYRQWLPSRPKDKPLSLKLMLKYFGISCVITDCSYFLIKLFQWLTILGPTRVHSPAVPKRSFWISTSKSHVWLLESYTNLDKDTAMQLFKASEQVPPGLKQGGQGLSSRPTAAWLPLQRIKRREHSRFHSCPLTLVCVVSWNLTLQDHVWIETCVSKLLLGPIYNPICVIYKCNIILWAGNRSYSSSSPFF